MVAMSFVRSAAEINEMRSHLARWGMKGSFIVAKLEDREGIENLADVLGVADGVLIARGDLGVALPREKVPGFQKTILRKANAAAVPVITATQMLESMIYRDRPTRAEVNDVHNAVVDGTDAVMLSGETAVGRYPVLAVREMDRIVREAEKELEAQALQGSVPRGSCPVNERDTLHDRIAASAVGLARNMTARCILAFSRSGTMLRALSAARGPVPVYGLVVDERLRRRLLLNRGLSLAILPREGLPEDPLTRALERLREDGILGSEERVVVVGSQSEPGMQATHSLKLHILE
jgi:pyruvate kinase